MVDIEDHVIDLRMALGSQVIILFKKENIFF